MSWRPILHVVGAVVAATGVAMVAAALVAVIYQEWDDALGIVVAAAITMAVGAVVWKVFDRPEELSTREGFASVGLAWFAIALFGALPYLITGSISDVTNAFFETAAGYTTTGASVVPDPAQLSHGIQFWRALTQWLGGMGVIVLSVALLPLLGMGAVQLARAEFPGGSPERLTPRFRETAKRLWLVYLGITVAQVILLAVGDMSLFESVAHAFTTMSTGGFSTSAGSLGAFSIYSQWVVIVFMVLAGISFTLHFRGLRDPLDYPRNSELRLYALILAAASAFILIGIWGGGVVETVTDSVFTGVSIITTTGYTATDYALWSVALQIMIVGLMFVGGMTGSTAGSIKVFRHQVLFTASRVDVRRLIHPRGVFLTRVGKEPVPDQVVEAVQTFFLLYMFVFMTGTFLLAIIGSVAEPRLDIVSTVSAVASSLGNVGPGLGAVGPSGSYLAVPVLGKWLLAIIMIVGRLEILPIILLFTRELWRK